MTLTQQKRLEALASYRLVGSPPEREYNNITQIAAQVAEAPYAYFALIDEQQIWLKSTAGFTWLKHVPVPWFCQRVIRGKKTVEIPDIRKQRFFHTHSFVSGPKKVKFYFGLPLVDADGFVLGSLVVMDKKVRQLQPFQKKSLRLLAEEIIRRMSARRDSFTEENRDLKEYVHIFKCFNEEKDKLKVALAEKTAITDALNRSAIVSITDTVGNIVSANEVFCRISGYSSSELVGQNHRLINSGFHPKSFWREMWKSLKAGKIWRAEICNRSKSGELYWVDTTVNPIHDENGKVCQYLSVRYLITERKRNEAALKRVNDLLERTNEAANIGYWESEVASREVIWSDITRRIHEMDEIRPVSVEEALSFFKEGKSRDAVVANFEEALISGQPYELEVQIVTAKGKERWVRLLCVPEQNKAGEVHRLYGTFQDINKRKTAELDLYAQRARLDHIISGTNVGTWEWNVQTGETIFNERWAEIIGYTLEELQPVSIETWGKYAHPDDLARSGEVLEKHFQGESEFYHFESRMRHRDGHWVWVLDRGKVISRTEDGKPLWMYGSHLEISEIKRMEEALRSNMLKFQSIFELSPVGIALNDPESGTFLHFNDSLLKATGYTAEELARLNYWKLTPPEFEQQTREIRRQLLEKGRYGPLEKEYIRKDGTRLPIALSGILYTDQDHQQAVLSVIQDFSERKKYENDLKDAKEMAEKANRAKSEFLANMSHEIRTPLNGVIGFTDLLMKTELSEDQYQYMMSVYHSANSLLDLINHILDFSKIEAGKLELVPEKTDLIQLTRQVADIVRLPAEKKKLAIHLEVTEGVPRFVRGDGLRLRQILVNLMGNAVKFTQEGSVTLKIDLTEPIRDNQASLDFSVRDTGVGIRPENQKKIFKAFSQADSSTTKKFGGTGLGLTISNKLLGLMGSRLELQSELGKGSSFSFRVGLPVMADSDPETQNATGGEQISPNLVLDQFHFPAVEKVDNLRVLVVEDNRVNMKLIRHYLKNINEKIELFEAENGLEGLHIYRENHPSMIITDISMPELNGYEFAREIRKMPEAFHVPIIALTAGAIAGERERCINAGMNDYLTKPVLQKTLKDMMQKWLPLDSRNSS
ncbi:MAG: PAS domain S-box protein [Calditrichaeota bacterium]|nr:PAS domain S-box protein [Calditrichota bacterium]